MKRNGYTLVELIVVVLCISIFATIAVTRMQLPLISKYKRQTLACKLNTDLRLARQFAITNAAVNSQGYALIIDSASHNYTIKDLLTNTIVATSTIDPGVTISGGTNFKFGPLGNLLTGSDTTVDITASENKSTITIVPGTGIVKMSES